MNKSRVLCVMAVAAIVVVGGLLVCVVARDLSVAERARFEILNFEQVASSYAPSERSPEQLANGCFRPAPDRRAE